MAQHESLLPRFPWAIKLWIRLIFGVIFIGVAWFFSDHAAPIIVWGTSLLAAGWLLLSFAGYSKNDSAAPRVAWRGVIMRTALAMALLGALLLMIGWILPQVLFID